MSLLMQALKRAEQAKKTAVATDAPSPADTAYPTLDRSVIAPPEPKPEPTFKTEVIPELQLSLADVPPAPELHIDPPQQVPAPAPAPSIALQDLLPAPLVPQQSVDAAMQSQQQAHAHLMAKQPTQSKGRFSMLAAALFALMLCCAAAFYYWQWMLPVPALPMPHPQAITPPPVSAPASNPAPVQPAMVAPEQVTPPRAASPAKAQRVAPIRATAAQADSEQIRIQKSERPGKINAILSEAYRLYTSGHRSEARPLYEAVLREEPNNRDALLGLAAIDLSQHHTEQASAHYSRLLDLDPSDADAIAGLTSLRSDAGEQSESQLKKVLARNPQSGATLFELGNVYGRQSRWSEAQEVYFRAFTLAPKNADYAFNLAVSLDRLGQTRLALDYYQQALTLSAAAPGNFSQAVAADRLAQLQAAN